MLNIQLKPDRSLRVMVSVASTALMLGVGLAGASAQELQRAPTATAIFGESNLVDLEDTFWICDWSSTLSRLGATQIASCASAAEELKARKFGGEFEKLIAWWQKNKAAVHRRLNAQYLAELHR